MNINPFEILKSAQKIQEQVGSMQDKLGSISETGSSGAGMVEVELSGKLEVLAVRIKPAVVDPTDVQMLQDLVAAAFTQAAEKVKGRIAREAESLTGGLSGLGGLGINLPNPFGGVS
ncbi:MAG: YbaB/EbfC family nucleoid-associated protein [Treponema sp.]|nr:YbaB/EbfC family nucleoid-associated protein [Treponema sp.]